VSESHKPNLRDKKKGEGEHLVMLATKSETRDVRNSPDQVLFVLVCKDILISANDITSLPSVVSNLLEDYEDVFPKETPAGLPPFRGIKHQIDLIPGAAFPNRPPYRTNPEETKKMKRQVQELLDKGFVHESLSPCVVPVILVPKRDGVGVLDRQTYQGGTRGSRLCGGDRDQETENSKVRARTRGTRFIQVRAAKVANPTSCLGDQVWRPALGVGLSPEGLGCAARYPALLYIVQGRVPSWLQGRSPSRFTQSES
jgi:hypothetical protein